LLNNNLLHLQTVRPTQKVAHVLNQTVLQMTIQMRL